MSISEPEQEVGVAIIGMAGRFPGAKNIEDFWENIQNGVSSLSHFSDEELRAGGIAPDMLRSPDFIKLGYVLEDGDLFDAGFFNISHGEAELIDPQQRLFLECAWQAMEDAGYVPGPDGGVVGVFGSAAFSTYLLNLLPDFSLAKPLKTMGILLGNDKDYLASRVSYKLNLTGPAVVSQTACSSSLVGICSACQALMEYQVDMALAGGVSLDVPAKHGYLYQNDDGAISRDCLCRAFDAEASGVATGNGIGVLALKRLSEAVADGDHIYAVIRGFAVNNDGSDKVGFTAPSVGGQRKVIAEALAMAGISSETIGYVETHGTGTIIGDPIEFQALNEAYGGSRLPRNSCAIGSLKTNIGHLNTAAGVASVIKTAMSLKYGKLAPSLHFKTPNPAINFQASPFYVNTSLRDWERGSSPLRAGVSSFGLGGTNAHVIMEEPPQPVVPTEEREWYLLPISARSESALEEAGRRLADYLMRTPQADLFHVGYTLQNGRASFPYRKIVLCQGREDAIKALTTGDAGHMLISRHPVTDAEKSVAFMFPGVGTQFVGMGAELYRKEPVFGEAMDRCADILLRLLGRDVRKVLYPEANDAEEAARQFEQPAVGLAGIFAVEYASACLWRSWGVEPQAMIGHSLGEYVAATLAGVFSLEDALRLVVRRGELMLDVPEGAMLIALASEEMLQSFLDDSLSIGAINGPALCMISGAVENVGALQAKLKAAKIAFRRLAGGRAGHSGMLEPLMGAFREAVSQVRLNTPSIPFLSNVTGDWIKPEEAVTPEYWVQHLRKTVRFSQGLEKLLQDRNRILLELGPGEGLKTLVARHPDFTAEHHVIAGMRDARRQDSDLPVLLKAFGALWTAGFKTDWNKVLNPNGKGRRLSLPTYPFERRAYSVKLGAGRNKDALVEASEKRSSIESWFYAPSWKRSLPPTQCHAKPHLLERKIWLLFNDSYGLGSTLTEKLKASGQDVVTVSAGAAFSFNGEEFCLSPGRQGDYENLFRTLMREERVPHHIVNLWNITSDKELKSGPAYFEEAQNYGYNSLIYLMRGLTASNLGTREMQLDVVSTGLHSVTGDETLSPEKSTLLGPCKVIPNEFPSFHCKNIDVEFPRGSEGMTQLADTLLAEFTCPYESFGTEKTVAYRGPHRWIQDFEELPLTYEAGKEAPLRERGVYLVTGGLGGVGYALAEHLAQACKAKLALIGRTKLPERDTWKQWLREHPEDDRISEAITKALRLEELGGEILLPVADVGNPAHMREALEQTVHRFGEINGVIHAAGVEGGGMIELRDLADVDSNTHAKVRGTLVIEELFKGKTLDFFALCSSLVSFIGSVGGVDYASANIFLDTFANARERSGPYNTVAINWDYWANIGMGRAIMRRHHSVFGDTMDKLAGEGMSEAIAPHEGTDAFMRLLSTRLPQVVVSTRDLPSLLKNLQKTTGAMREVFDQAELETQAHPRPKLAVPFAAPENEDEQIILGIWQSVLGIEGLGVRDPYFDLGGDSLHAMPLIARLRETFRIEIPLRIVYSHGTVAEMAKFVAETRRIGTPTETGRPTSEN